MGRKKRKVVDTQSNTTAQQQDVAPTTGMAGTEPIVVKHEIGAATSLKNAPNNDNDVSSVITGAQTEEAPDFPPPAAAASGYSIQSHKGTIVEEDIYVSDGSEDDEGDELAGGGEVEITLQNSRMGIMRRTADARWLQPTRQWVKGQPQQQQQQQSSNPEGGGGEENENAENQDSNVSDNQGGDGEQNSNDLALTPAQRAARLLQEKQRKLHQAREAARRLESEENAGRDPCLFSKRTAFDIRMDQIEDKPWTRSGGGSHEDFFNYSLSQQDWMDYASLQLSIRQELTDASRQRRPLDSTIVPVTPRTPSKQTPKVAVASASGTLLNTNSNVMVTLTSTNAEGDQVVGPATIATTTTDDKDNVEDLLCKVVAAPIKEDTSQQDLVHAGVGGAWGAGATPGSKLERLIQEQERRLSNGAGGDQPHSYYGHQQPPRRNSSDRYSGGGGGNRFGNNNNNYYGGDGNDWHPGGNKGFHQQDDNSSTAGGNDDHNNYHGGGDNQQQGFDRYQGGGDDRFGHANDGGGRYHQQQQQQHYNNRFGGGRGGRFDGPPPFARQRFPPGTDGPPQQQQDPQQFHYHGGQGGGGGDFYRGGGGGRFMDRPPYQQQQQQPGPPMQQQQPPWGGGRPHGASRKRSRDWRR